MSYHNQPISSRSDLNAHRSKDHKGRITSSQQALSVHDRALEWIDTTLKSLDLKAGSLICSIIRKIERMQSLSTEAERKLDRHTSRMGNDRPHQHDRTSHSLRGSPGRRRMSDTLSTEGRREVYPSGKTPRVRNQYFSDPSTRQLTMSRGKDHNRPKGTSNPRPRIAYDPTVAPLIRESLAAHGHIKVRAPTTEKKTVQITDERSSSRTIGEKRKTVQTPVPYSSLMWRSTSSSSGLRW